MNRRQCPPEFNSIGAASENSIYSAEVLSSATDIHELAHRARPLLLGKEDLSQPEFFLASVSGKSWIPRVVVLTRDRVVSGIVYLKEKKLAALPAGIIYGDASLSSMLVAEPNRRESVLFAALEAILAQPGVRGLRIVAPPQGLEMSTIQSLAASIPLDFCYTKFENHRVLPLPARYDAFLESVGADTRHNFRRYRRRSEAAGHRYVEEVPFADFEKAAHYLFDQSAIEMDQSALDRALRIVSAVNRPFLTGLRGCGEWLSIAAGWYELNRAVLFVQMNSDKRHGRSSLSVVLRGYLIEMLIERGIGEIVFWGGAGALDRYAKPIPTVAVHVDTPRLAWRMVRRSVASLSGTGPARLAFIADWITPRAPQGVIPARIQVAKADRRMLDEKVRVGALVAAVFAFCMILLYGMPGLAELALARHFPWISCVLLSDLAGSAFLFLLGFKRLAVTIYLITSATEAVLLGTREVSAHSLVWLTNLLPALLAAGILSYRAYAEARKTTLDSPGEISAA